MLHSDEHITWKWNAAVCRGESSSNRPCHPLPCRTKSGFPAATGNPALRFASSGGPERLSCSPFGSWAVEDLADMATCPWQTACETVSLRAFGVVSCRDGIPTGGLWVLRSNRWETCCALYSLALAHWADVSVPSWDQCSFKLVCGHAS